MNRSGRAALGLLIFFATLPLQWQALAESPAGVVRPFHVGLLALVVLAPASLGNVGRLLRSARPLGIALFVYLLLQLTAGVIWAEGLNDIVQQLVYAISGLIVGGAIVEALGTDRGRRRLAWVSPVALASFLLQFAQALTAAGIAPGGAVTAALSGAGGYRSYSFFILAFRETGAVEGSQARHEIMAALLVALYASWVAARGRAMRALLFVCTGLTVGIVGLSGSRAVILAAGLVLLVGVARFVRSARIAGVSVLGGLAAAGVLALYGDRVWAALDARFFADTGSYEERTEGYAELTGNGLLNRMLFGGPPPEISTHNIVTDALLRGTVFAAIAALVVVLVFSAQTWRAFRRYLLDGSARDMSATGAGLLVLVRAFTIGGGYLHLVEWSAFGIVLAVGLAAAGPDRQDETAPATRGGELARS